MRGFWNRFDRLWAGLGDDPLDIPRRPVDQQASDLSPRISAWTSHQIQEWAEAIDLAVNPSVRSASAAPSRESRREKSISIDDASAAPDVEGPLAATSYSLTPGSVTRTEGNVSITFTVTRSGDLPAQTIYASTLFDTATSASGDYDPLVNRAVNFSSGETSETFTVSINEDSIVESTEHFRVMIGATTAAGPSQALDISDV